MFFFFFQAEDGIRDWSVTGVQTCALPITDQSQAEDGIRDWSVTGVQTSELQSLTNLVCRLLLEIGNAQVSTQVTNQSRMPASAWKKVFRHLHPCHTMIKQHFLPVGAVLHRRIR